MSMIKLDFKVSSWDKARPKEIKGTKLANALKDVEQAQAAMKKKSDASAIDGCIASLKKTSTATQDTIKKECDAKKHKDLIAALKKFNAECDAEIKKLEGSKARKGDDEEGDEDISDEELFGIKQFKACIKKAKLKSSTEDGVSFCLAVHKDPLQCKLVFMKKKKFATQTFKRVYKLSKENPELGLKRPKMTYGAAYRDPESKETLVLHIVDGAPTDIPGMARKLEKWRKKNKQDLLPFKELSIRTPSGQPLEMTPDPDEEEAEVQTGAAAAESQADLEEEEVIQAATSASEAQAALEDEEEEVQAATRPTATGEAPATQAVGAEATEEAAAENRRKEFRQACRTWQIVKEQAIQDLEAVKDGIRDYYLDDPEQFKLATSKLSQLDAIMDNLNDDLRDVLDSYIATPKNRQSELQRLGAEAKEIVQQFLDYASRDKLLNAVDQKEFADVTVKAPIEKALRDLVKTLG